MDVLLSWNYRHLANVPRKHQIQVVNIAQNYFSPLDIVAPLEVIADVSPEADDEDFSGASRGLENETPLV